MDELKYSILNLQPTYLDICAQMIWYNILGILECLITFLLFPNFCFSINFLHISYIEMFPQQEDYIKAAVQMTELL